MTRELFAIPTIGTDDYELANQAQIGAEKRAFYSLAALLNIGKVEMDAADAGTLTLRSTYTAPTSKASGYNMQCVLTGPLKSLAACVLTFAATFTGGTITSSTSATPGVITVSVAHGLTNGDLVDISGVTGVGATVLNGTDQVVTVVSPTTFSTNVATTGVGAGGTWAKKGSVTATFSPPARATDATFDLPQGLAVDLVGVGSSSTFQIRTINSLTSITGGGAGARFDLVSLPSRLTAIEIPGVTDFKPGIPSPTSVAVPNNYDATGWLVRGRDTEDGMTLTAQYLGFVEGLTRLNGQRFTIFIEKRADGRLLRERMVLSGCRGQVGIDDGDGDNKTTANVSAKYETFAVFV